MQIPSSVAVRALIHGFFQLYPEDAAKLLNTLTASEIVHYLKREDNVLRAEIFARLNPEIAAPVIPHMDKDLFIHLFETIDPSLAARLLSQLEARVVNKQLAHLSSSLSAEIREIMTYPLDTAGSLMDPRVSTFYVDNTVDDVLKRIRSIQDRKIVNINVIDNDGKLIGVIPLQDVAVSQVSDKLGNLMNRQPIAIQAMASREEVVQVLEEQKLISLPVVDMQGILLGIIRYDALVNAAKVDATEDLQAMFGAGREERALSKVRFAISKRLPWLEINLATAFLAAAVVGIFEETIARITVLAVFLPVVAGQSGNTGSQALAVAMRGLALREIRTRDWFRLARKEILVGFFNGCAIALTTSVIVFFWADSLGLAAVIAVAMVFSMVIAGFSGAVIPLLLKAFGQDPAQSSSIILTTVTDIVGFLSFLGLATIMASMLSIS